jgi:putative ABC transport system substrate-binding protein
LTNKSVFCKRIKKVLAALALLLSIGEVCADCSFSEGTKKIVVILSGEIQPYRDALAGFKEKLKMAPYSLTYEEFILTPEAGVNEAIKKEIARNAPDLIFTLGTQASLLAKSNFREMPVIFTMVLNPVENGVIESMERPEENISGVSLNVPIEEQFLILKLVAPGTKSVGLMYDARTGTALVDAAENAARKVGVKLVAEPVLAEKNISNVLNKVLSSSDSLLASPDPLIYNSSTAQQIILSTIKAHVAFMAFSRNYVKAGALMALECDYFGVGEQSAAMAVKVFDQGGLLGIKVESPRKLSLIINIHTATLIGVQIDEELLADAETFGK